MAEIGDKCIVCQGVIGSVSSESYVHDGVQGFINNTYCENDHKVLTWTDQTDPIDVAQKSKQPVVTVIKKMTATIEVNPVTEEIK